MSDNPGEAAYAAAHPGAPAPLAALDAPTGTDAQNNAPAVEAGDAGPHQGLNAGFTEGDQNPQGRKTAGDPFAQYKVKGGVPAADPFERYKVATQPQPSGTKAPTLAESEADTGDTEGSPATTRQSALVARGMVGGAASLVTVPADVSIGAINWVKKHVFGYGDHDLGPFAPLETNASDLVQKGLTKLGMPEPQNTGESALTAAGTVAGSVPGIMTGLSGPARPLPLGPDAGTGGAGSFTNAVSAGQRARNIQIQNNSWGQQIGEPGVTKLLPQVLNQADTRIGGILDNARGANRVYMGDPADVSSKLATIAENTHPDLLQNPTIQRLISLFRDGHGTAILDSEGASHATIPAVVNSEQLGAISSTLGKAAKTTIQRDHELGTGLFQAKDMVEGMISEGMPPEQKAVYDAARGQYRALWGQLLANPSHINPSTGDVNGVAMATFLQRTDPTGFALGRNTTPGYAAARAAQIQAGTNNVADQGIVAHVPFLRALARVAPATLQNLKQAGNNLSAAIPAIAKQVINKPGFMAALSREFEQLGGQPNQTLPSSQQVNQ